MENPLRTWFKFPKPSIYFGHIISGLPNKWIELHSYDVTWKYQLLLTFQTNNNDVCWETILDIIYYNKSLKEAINRNTWYSKAFIKGFLTPKGERVYLYE